jgi:hypothetical protein
MFMREVAGQKYGTEMPPGASNLAQIDMISILSFLVHLLLPIGIFCLPLVFCGAAYMTKRFRHRVYDNTCVLILNSVCVRVCINWGLGRH